MERCVLLVFTLLCIYATFSCAEGTIEMSQPNVRCPDGKSFCPAENTCCPSITPGRWTCCPFGPFARCCPDRRNCCPQGMACVGTRCVRMTYSSVLRVQAILLVNGTDKRFPYGTVGMDPKVSRIIPSQQVEAALKRSGLIGTSGDFFSPDEKYQCPDGTSICELSPGIYGCCPIQNARRRTSKYILP